MRDWTSHYDFMVMYLLDFELVLGMDFLTAAKVGILSYLGSLDFFGVWDALSCKDRVDEGRTKF